MLDEALKDLKTYVPDTTYYTKPITQEQAEKIRNTHARPFKGIEKLLS